MTDVTQILAQLESGDPSVAEQLLPLVYDELRKLAAAKLAHEKPGRTLQATALVHEAYLRLVDVNQPQQWNSRGHFFGAAAEAMRRILVENARRRRAAKRGGDRARDDLPESRIAAPRAEIDPVELSDALDRLAGTDAQAAELVKLRYFAGLTLQQAAETMAVSARTADRIWSYARCWLLKELRPET
jgi:RNA polymerase sigma factor (TIGR02999 family)